jgi:DNA-binding beta-propeller fold protein YncE
MKKIFAVLFAGLAAFCLSRASTLAETLSRKVALPTSKTITLPVPGFVARTNSYPSAIAISPDGRYAALLNQGYGTLQSGLAQSIGVLDLAGNRLADFPDARLRADEKSTLQSYFVGLAVSSDGGHLYASLSSVSQSGIAIYKFVHGQVTPERFITIPAQQLAQSKQLAYKADNIAAGTAPAYPAGFAVIATQAGDRLLVANNLSDNAVLLDVASGRILNAFDLSTESKYVPAAYPYSAIANKAGTKAWVSLWNNSAVVELDLATGKVAHRIEFRRSADSADPGVHPTSMVLNPREDILYVALSNAATAESDGIAAVNLKTGLTVRTYVVALNKNDAVGAVPIAIALSHDGSHLYATSASLNAVAVFDVAHVGKSSGGAIWPLGFIPTEWYPSAIAVAGNDLLIATAKGEGAGPNNMKATLQSSLHPVPHPYIPTLIGGSLQRLSLRVIGKNLRSFTRQVEEDNLLHVDPGKIVFASGANPIRHVIYVLRENRTYDQILGDLPAGDGDPSLTMYGAAITPNAHKLALQFGVLDNFYDSGEVSANGHLWSDGAASSDYIEKIWPILYRGSERPEDFGNALEQELPSMDDPGTGFLWDNLARHRFSYRLYGEMTETIWCKDEKVVTPREGTPSQVADACPAAEIAQGGTLPPGVGNPRGGASPWPWAVPRFETARPTNAAQRDHLDPLYPDFEVDYPDQLRADEFLREFDGFASARGTAQGLPQFVLLYLPDDHTGGTRVGKPTPRASVADNDLALGRVVDAVSHSPYWDDTAIFVVEDDAQNGADHVDAHRSIALVISKYSPRGRQPFVDHHFYTTVGMIHTMEDLIGLPPIDLFDTHAPLIAPLFAGTGMQPPYQADDSNLKNGLLYETNVQKAPGAQKSAKLDFTRPDAADATTLNRILWDDARASSSRPVPRLGALP